MTQKSILDYFFAHVEQRPSATAALAKRDGAYRELTWRQIADEARRVSMGLVALGIEPQDRVIILCQTSLEWVTLDVGILGAAGVVVPIYPSNLASECQYIIENSESVVAFAEDAGQVDKLRAERSRMPQLRKVIQIRGEVREADDWVMSYADFLALAEPDDAVLDERRNLLSKDSVLTIIYTSGTTGKPKGVVLTHDAMIYEAEAIEEIQVVEPDDIQLFWLPLAHSFAKVLEIAWISTGHIIAFAESLETIRDNLGETRPTFMAGVPRLFEKFYAAVVQKGTAPGGVKAKLFTEALRLSQKNGEAEFRGSALPLADAIRFKILKRLVFKKVGAGLEELMGGRLKFMISGGAPLSPAIAYFFRDAGITILEGWGLTETSAATCVNRPGKNRIGTVGPPMPGTELRIAEDGEILVKGRGVMREYWRNPAATEEVFQNKWFSTGDIGSIDEEGHLRITDRKKDIIVTAGGKNVAPQNIENLVKTDKLISNVVVHGDKRKFLTAVVTLDEAALRNFAQTRALGDGSYAELSQRPEVHTAVQEAIDHFNSQLASYETIKKFKILEHDFTIESGELTPSVKVKRKVVYDRYKGLFDSFYAE